MEDTAVTRTHQVKRQGITEQTTTNRVKATMTTEAKAEAIMAMRERTLQ